MTDNPQTPDLTITRPPAIMYLSLQTWRVIFHLMNRIQERASRCVAPTSMEMSDGALSGFLKIANSSLL